MHIILTESDRKDKKYMVIIPKLLNNSYNKSIIEKNFKKVYFGQNGYNDYLIYSEFNNPKKEIYKKSYIKRHSSNNKQDWTINGIFTPGFWAKHILWNKETLEESIKDIYNKFKINVTYI